MSGKCGFTFVKLFQWTLPIPLANSKVENHCAPDNASSASSILFKGYASFFVIELSLRKSMQNLVDPSVGNQISRSRPGTITKLYDILFKRFLKFGVNNALEIVYFIGFSYPVSMLCSTKSV